MQIGKIKGTLVNFNDLEHILDDLDAVATWQIELSKRNHDPLESDEIIVHVARSSRSSREEVTRLIEKRFLEATEIRPNRIEFHEAETLREMQGVGRLLKEEKIVDRRELASTSDGESLTPVPTS